VSITSNTGPLIALAKSDHLGLLRDRFGEVRIPPAVESELFAKAGPETIRLQSAMRHYLRRVDAATLSPLAATRVGHLGRGEKQAIAAALSGATPLLIDDYQAREAAKDLGLTITGTVGVVLKAKEVGFVAAALPILVQIRRDGYWLSDAILRHAASIAGE